MITTLSSREFNHDHVRRMDKLKRLLPAYRHHPALARWRRW